MGVANTKSTLVSNADAATQTLNVASLSQGKLYSSVATVEIAAADDDGSVYRMMSVHSSWRLMNIRLANDAIAGLTSLDIGLYQTAKNGAAVVDKDAYLAALDAHLASTGAINYAIAGARAIEKLGQAVWEDAALSADPGRWYDLCFTANTVGTAAGTLVLAIEYTVPGA